jgi:PAS domain S-box-containing protein
MTEETSASDRRDHAQIEHALRKSEERFRQVVEGAPNAMIMVDETGRIEMVNAQSESLFGYNRAELLGHPVDMLVPDRLRGHHPDLRQLFYLEPRSRPMGAGRDLYALRKDGSEFPVEIGLNPISTDEGLMVLSAIVDISDRKSKEQRIEAALREKDILLGEIHHRVKNNLQVIDSLLNLQSVRIGDSHVQEMMRESQNRIRSMALIHQTLYQSHDFAEVDFGQFMNSLVRSLTVSYGVDPSRIGISLELHAVTLPIDSAIPTGLIVNELLSNALKHAFPAGRSGQITIGLEQIDAGFIRLSVTDDGVGLPADLELDNAHSLGLQLVTLLADQLGGTIDMQRSGPTRFVLKFMPKKPRGHL